MPDDVPLSRLWEKVDVSFLRDWKVFLSSVSLSLSLALPPNRAIPMHRKMVSEFMEEERPICADEINGKISFGFLCKLRRNSKVQIIKIKNGQN